MPAPKFFVPLLTKNDDSERRTLDEAKQNMRITLMGFSYGGMFIAGVRKSLVHTMQNLGYVESEIKDIFAQVLQINFGVQYSTEEAIKPEFSTLHLINKYDNQGALYSWIVNHFVQTEPTLYQQTCPHNFFMLEYPSIRYDGDNITNRLTGEPIAHPHSLAGYIHSLASETDLANSIRKNISANRITDLPSSVNHSNRVFADNLLYELRIIHEQFLQSRDAEQGMP